MSYEPTVWSEGDFITADKLNKMEQGIKNEQVGPQGPKGDQGPAGPKAVSYTHLDVYNRQVYYQRYPDRLQEGR